MHDMPGFACAGLRFIALNADRRKERIKGSIGNIIYN